MAAISLQGPDTENCVIYHQGLKSVCSFHRSLRILIFDMSQTLWKASHLLQ